jgi:hypothetical protein
MRVLWNTALPVTWRLQDLQSAILLQKWLVTVHIAHLLAEMAPDGFDHHAGLADRPSLTLAIKIYVTTRFLCEEISRNFILPEERSLRHLEATLTCPISPESQ